MGFCDCAHPVVKIFPVTVKKKSNKLHNLLTVCTAMACNHCDWPKIFLIIMSTGNTSKLQFQKMQQQNQNPQ